MRLRVALGRFLVRLGRLIQSLAVMVMRPEDLIAFSHRTYSKNTSVESWGKADIIDSGLDPEEINLLNKIPKKDGHMLILGVGGGREAIPLSRMGFTVTGVDFVPEMIKRAEENARAKGVRINSFVQEISKLDVPGGSYDIVWLSSCMYSCIPTQGRRIGMLKKISNALKPEGYFVCQFHWDSNPGFTPKVELVRKAFALITLGNLWYEKGDMLWHNIEFIHAFSTEDELCSELESGGFEIAYMHIDQDLRRGGAVLKKRR